MGCFGTDLSRVRRAVSSCLAPAPSRFIFNSLTLYFNVIALPPSATLLSCLAQQILPRQGTTATTTTTTTWASTGVWDVGRSSFLGFAFFFFFLHIYIFDGCGCQVYFPGYILLFFSSLLCLLFFFFTFATLPSQLAEPKIVCTALKKAAVETGVARLIAALSQSAKGATSAAAVAAAATATQQKQSI